jgi:signal transduction histidine kinase
MLLDGDAGELNKEQRDFLEKTYKSNERMISLINDLLNVTRIEEGRYIYQPLFCDFVGIVQAVVDLYQREIEKKNIKFEFKEPEQKLPRILADEEKMKLAVENLLNNAIGYTFPGGSIIISIDLLENEIEFKIEDTGTGIPKDEQSRVFSKFFRGINAIRMETEGSGLGLFVTKNIIEAHGGRIWFKSEEGRGSTFYFTLPLARSKIE